MTQAILIATIYPTPGKADRVCLMPDHQRHTHILQVVELLLETSKIVQTKEPYVTEYSCYREISFKDGQEDIVMFER